MFTAQLGGIALGLTMSGALFVNTAMDGLSTVLPDASDAELQAALSGTSGEYFQSLGESAREAAVSVIVESMSKVYILLYVAAAFCLVLSICFTVRKHASCRYCFRGKGKRGSLTQLARSNERCSRTRWRLSREKSDLDLGEIRSKGRYRACARTM